MGFLSFQLRESGCGVALTASIGGIGVVGRLLDSCIEVVMNNPHLRAGNVATKLA